MAKRSRTRYGHAFHRQFGRYFYAHRAGATGVFAPLVMFSVGFKIITMRG